MNRSNRMRNQGLMEYGVMITYLACFGTTVVYLDRLSAGLQAGVMILFIVVAFLLYAWLRKQLLARIEDENKTYVRLVEQLSTAIVVVTDRKIMWVNRAAQTLLQGPVPQELLGKNIDNFIFTEQEHLNFSQKEKSGRAQAILVDLHGQEIEVEIDYAISSRQKGEWVCLLIRNMAEFEESQKQIQHVEQLSVIGELAAGIAHEIRNPLTSLKGFIQLTANDKKSGANSYTEIMISEVDRISMIVGELLLLSKPRELVLESKQLMPMINTVTTIANTQAILHNIEVETTFEPGTEQLTVNCDENKLKQVFINILKNAIEAMTSTGIITLHVSKREGHVVISCQDQGPGIPKDKLAKLGQRFYTTKDNGTGLGLMVCFSIIEHHQGTIKIESEVGKGTTVEIALPGSDPSSNNGQWSR
ncbi:ATP-binding protein [Desertibacillus haloalkaliphilus]|uniref:ATP-binding protein n=1 Tax=Desertibacillus haloalkaliphilus TaxID=1328930 RepID=UPI001C25E57D|nr:ATP-binding protein [Desertibacillus haloalkaliphilus]MBU8905311.1 GHKL domain-containing protein [Desertibacillus haloalkaliphilus]